ncbi:LysR family transcriptional regulator [uncultured Agrococcus sp.]|uniref:LysR family transcriptional regulator n=1 Tax=uncultured Agrococcus sp. TaxID=382258 RepID=UPI0025D4FCB2|nr:LysR family transcriptional regulator [uncultured Agrococcus sp.]
MFEVKRLRLLWELNARGTVAAVAEALNYSPSAVSQQLAILESEAGVPLTRRVGRGLELTPAADVLVAETADLLDRLEFAQALVKGTEKYVLGTVRVAVFQTAVLALMPHALRHLRREHPKLRVEMVQHEPEEALYETSARGFDLVVAEEYPGHAVQATASLTRSNLTRDRLSLAVPVGDARYDEWPPIRRLEDAATIPWVMEPRGAASRHWAEQLCRVAGFEPDVRYETADLQAHVRLVESGHAVAVLPDLVRVDRATSFRTVALDGNPHRTILTATREAASESPAVRAVRAALAAAVEHLHEAT